MREQVQMVWELWIPLEEALKEVSPVYGTSEAMIDGLKGRLAPNVIRNLHYVRTQRNALNHANAQPLDDPTKWKRLCLESLVSVRSLASGSTEISARTGGVSSTSQSTAAQRETALAEDYPELKRVNGITPPPRFAGDRPKYTGPGNYQYHTASELKPKIQPEPPKTSLYSHEWLRLAIIVIAITGIFIYWLKQ